MSNKAFAIVAGVGSGTGASIARLFAKSYPVALLARNPSNFEGLVEEINKSGGKAIGISTDVSSEDSVKSAMDKIREQYGGSAPCAAAIYQASGGFAKKPFLNMTLDEFDKSWNVTVYILRFRYAIVHLSNLNTVKAPSSSHRPYYRSSSVRPKIRRRSTHQH